MYFPVLRDENSLGKNKNSSHQPVLTAKGWAEQFCHLRWENYIYWVKIQTKLSKIYNSTKYISTIEL